MFIHTFLLVFLAEMADKTQLMMMALTNKYKIRSVIFGMIGGVVIISALSVLAGDLIGDLIPMSVVKLCAASLFLIFGMVNLFPGKEEQHSAMDLRIPTLSVALTFLLAELGDKTQLTTVAVAADHMDQHTTIFLGASLGLILANLIGIAASKVIFSKFSEDTVKILASFIFFIFGSINLFEVIHVDTIVLCLYSVGLILLACFCYEKSRNHKVSSR